MALTLPLQSPPFTFGKKTPPRERILLAAQELFYRHGIHTVGVDMIAAAADSNKMTLYRHFRSKDVLITECVSAWATEFEATWAVIEKMHRGDFRQQLIAWVDNLSDFLLRDEGRGCALANATIEIADKSHPAHQIIESRKIWQWEKLLMLCHKGEFDDPEALADEIFLLFEGARISVKYVGVNGPAARVDRMLRSVISRHARA